MFSLLWVVPAISEGGSDVQTFRGSAVGSRIPDGRGRTDGKRRGKEDHVAAAEDEGLRRQLEGGEGEDRRHGRRRLPQVHERMFEEAELTHSGLAGAGPTHLRARTEHGLASFMPEIHR